MKVVNIGNIAEAYICDDLPAMGIVIEATLDELSRLAWEAPRRNKYRRH